MQSSAISASVDRRDMAAASWTALAGRRGEATMWPGPNDPPISVNSESLKEKLLAAKEKISSRERVEPRPAPCENPADCVRRPAAAPDAKPQFSVPDSSGYRSQVLSLVFRTLRPWPNSSLTDPNA